MLKSLIIFIFSSLIFISCSENFAENELALITELTTQEPNPLELKDAQCLVREMKNEIPSADYDKFIDTLLLMEDPNFGEDMTMDESMELMGMVMMNAGFMKKAGETCSVDMDTLG